MIGRPKSKGELSLSLYTALEVANKSCVTSSKYQNHQSGKK